MKSQAATNSDQTNDCISIHIQSIDIIDKPRHRLLPHSTRRKVSGSRRETWKHHETSSRSGRSGRGGRSGYTAREAMLTLDEVQFRSIINHDE